MNAPKLWSRILIIVGSVAMVVGAIDPMEGSLIILPGSGLVALGTFLAKSERRLIVYRVWVFILIAIGVGALWGLSAVGGCSSGLSMWWGVLYLPYLIGWSMGIWGPGSPRWLLLGGIGVGLYYSALITLVLEGRSLQDGGDIIIALAIIGVLTIGVCIYRLMKPNKGEAR